MKEQTLEKAAEEMWQKRSPIGRLHRLYLQGFLDCAEWQQSQVSDEAEKIALDLAAWSIKYPRSVVYSMNSTMDKELISLEERARIYKQSKPLTHE